MLDLTTDEAARLCSPIIMASYARAAAHQSIVRIPSQASCAAVAATDGIARLELLKSSGGHRLIPPRATGQMRRVSVVIGGLWQRLGRGANVVVSRAMTKPRAALLPSAASDGALAPGVGVVLSHRPQSTASISSAPTADMGPLATSRVLVGGRYAKKYKNVISRSTQGCG